MGGDDQSRSQYERMTQSRIAPLILKLSVPTTLSMLMTSIYNLADTAFVGQLGTSASGAVGIVFGFMSIIQATGFLFGQGAGSIASRSLGAHDTDEASAVASTGFVLSFAAGTVLALVSFAFLDQLIVVLGSTPTIAPYAKTYMRYILLATPFMTASFLMNQVLRYEGRAVLGMAGMMTGGLLNIIGDMIFIFGFDMGVDGAGLSTAISQAVGFSILLGMFITKRATSRISLKHVRLDGATVLDICATGLPSMIRQGLTGYTTMLLNAQASAYGDAAIAAMSIVNRIVFFVFSIALGVGQGFQPVCAFNYGAGKYGRVRKAFRATLAICEILMAVFVAALLLFSGNLVQIFRDDPEVIEIGTRALRIQGSALLVIPLSMVVEMLHQSSGKKLGASLISALRGGIIFIPALLILAHLRGLDGIEEAQAVAYVLAVPLALYLAARYFNGLPKDDESSADQPTR